MIVVLKKSRVALVCLIFTLLLVVISINIKDDTNNISNMINQGRDIPVAKKGDTQKVIILDPGHGGEDPGAVSEYSGVKEKDINLKIAFKLKELLEKQNYEVIMTREEDILKYDENTKDIYQKRKQDLTQRKKIMDEGGGDIVVSIHLNCFPQTQYHGAQVFYPPNSNESQQLANSIQNSLKKNVDPENKRVAMVKEPPQGQKPIMILRDIKTTTVIVECGFLSNFNEEAKLRTDEYQNKLADGIRAGIINYFTGKD
jgi:N-acetylmuramoyl-L-alanine amidase